MAASTTRTVKAKFDGDAKGLIAAAKEGEAAVDHFGKDVEKKFRGSGDKAAKGFGSSIKKWFRGEGGGLFKEIGKSGGTVFGSGLLGALKTPILGPALLAAFAAVALTVLPAAGAIAGGALVTGFGAGLAGLGLVFAAKSQVVQDKWRETMAQLGADMRLLSRPFESTLIGVADIFERTVDRFNPHLAKAFSKMADPIEDFADDAGHALEQLIPAIDPVTDAFNAVLDSLGPALTDALGDVSAGVSDLAASVRENPEALADMVRGIGDVTRLGLDLITTLNNVNGKFEQLSRGTSLVDATFSALEYQMGPLITLFEGLEKGIGLVNALTHSTDASGASMRQAGLDVNSAIEAYQKAGGAAKGLIPPVEDSAKAVEEQARQAAEAKRKFEGLVTAMFATQNAALSLSGAQINLQDAFDNAAASVQENGRTLDINTEKGRANRTALNQVAQAANQQTESMIRNGKSTAVAARTAESSRANFIRLATQMGLSKKAATVMAAEMIAIPNVSRQAKLTANKVDLERKLAAAKAALADPNLTKERRAKLTAEKEQLERAVAAAKAALASIQGRTVYINAVVTERVNRVQDRLDRIAGGAGRASGGLMQPGRAYLLGERGPEPVVMGPNGGARVLSAESAPRELTRDDRPIVIENHIEIGGEVVRVVRTEIRADKRDTKRRVGAR